jgi:hypothetical protein
MRKLRIFAAGVWYLVSTAVNNREPLFWSPRERARFEQVLCEARVRNAFVLCGLRFSGPTVSFYIKPVDGFQLPEIMQWIKQTYSVRYNVYDGRTGHIWGDRYASWIAAGGRKGVCVCAGGLHGGAQGKEAREGQGRRRAGKRYASRKSGDRRQGQPLRGGNGPKQRLATRFAPPPRPSARLSGLKQPG